MSVRARVFGVVFMALFVSIGACAGPASVLAETPQDHDTSITVNAKLLPDPVLGDGWTWWYNDPKVAVTFLASATADVDTAHPVDIGGFAYIFDHTPTTTLSTPGQSSNTAYAPAEFGGSGTVKPISTLGVDLDGWVDRLVTPYWIDGMHDPVEGKWYLHAQSVTARVDGSKPPSGTVVVGNEATVHFGIDVTPPSTPKNFKPTAVLVNGNTIGSSVCDFAWDNPGFSGEDYDSLSGDSLWRVYENGTLVRTFQNVLSWPKAGATIEDLNPGANTIEVSVIDYAGNESKHAAFKLYSDPDTPKVSISKPAGSLLGVTPTIAANASDGGGVVSVVFKMDGKRISTVTTAPYQDAVNLRGFRAGKHTLTATVTDHYGRQATASRVVTLDRAVPVLTRTVSLSKRKITVKAHLSEKGAVAFGYIVSTVSSQEKVATKTLSKAGTVTFTITVPRVGADTYAYRHGLKVPYELLAVDRSGNYSKRLHGSVSALLRVGEEGSQSGRSRELLTRVRYPGAAALIRDV